MISSHRSFVKYKKAFHLTALSRARSPAASSASAASSSSSSAVSLAARFLFCVFGFKAFAASRWRAVRGVVAGVLPGLESLGSLGSGVVGRVLPVRERDESSSTVCDLSRTVKEDVAEVERVGVGAFVFLGPLLFPLATVFGVLLAAVSGAFLAIFLGVSRRWELKSSPKCMGENISTIILIRQKAIAVSLFLSYYSSMDLVFTAIRTEVLWMCICKSQLSASTKECAVPMFSL